MPCLALEVRSSYILIPYRYFPEELAFNSPEALRIVQGYCTDRNEKANMARDFTEPKEEGYALGATSSPHSSINCCMSL